MPPKEQQPLTPIMVFLRITIPELDPEHLAQLLRMAQELASNYPNATVDLTTGPVRPGPR